VKENLDTICMEIRNTLQAIAMTASVVTHARLVTTDGAGVTDDTQFVKRIDDHLRLIHPLEQQVSRVHAYREVIREHADAVVVKTGGLHSFAAFVSINSRRYSESDVADALVDVYVSTRFYNEICRLPNLVARALCDVRSTAEDDPGSADGRNTDLLLEQWAVAFGDLESRANFAALGLDPVAIELAR
jgi:hypothetical protein